MTFKNHKGSCQCGSVKLAIIKEHLVSYICHCLECQKQAASAFAISVPLNLSDITITGKLEYYQRPAASGATTKCFFCPVCGTRIYHKSSGAHDKVTLKGGVLDNAHLLTPISHLWVSRKHSWVAIPENIETFAEQPADLITWRKNLQR